MAILPCLSSLLLAVCLIHNSLGLSCLPCSPEDARPDPKNCPRGLYTPPCKCYKECAKDIGDVCGGLFGTLGQCGDGLECKLDETDTSDDIDTIPNFDGICVIKGMCPEPGVGSCEESCDEDDDCPGQQMCCNNGCGHSCMNPVGERCGKISCSLNQQCIKVAECPQRKCKKKKTCLPIDYRTCKDVSCQKCRMVQLRNGVAPTLPPDPVCEKEGKCPEPTGFGICVEECSANLDCPERQLCCSNGCGHVCMNPVGEQCGSTTCNTNEKCIKAFQCPEPDCESFKTCLPNDAPTCNDISCPRDTPCRMVQLKNCLVPPCYPDPYCDTEDTCPEPTGFGICVEECSADRECPGKQLCCSNGCGHVCMDPVVRGGKCPEPSGPGICVEACSADGQCPGEQLCCSNGCGHTCMDPEELPPIPCEEGRNRKCIMDPLRESCVLGHTIAKVHAWEIPLNTCYVKVCVCHPKASWYTYYKTFYFPCECPFLQPL